MRPVLLNPAWPTSAQGSETCLAKSMLRLLCESIILRRTAHKVIGKKKETRNTTQKLHMVFWKKRDKAEEKKEDDHTFTIPNNNNDFAENRPSNTVGLNTDDVLDVVIIGAGWAGISAGMFLLCSMQAHITAALIALSAPNLLSSPPHQLHSRHVEEKGH